MITPITEVNKKIYNILQAVNCPIFEPHKSQKYPYGLIVSTSYEPNYDTTTNLGGNAFVTIHVYSDYSGDKEVNDLMEKILTKVLEFEDVEAEWTIFDIGLKEATVERLEDGIRRGLIELNVRVWRS